MENPKKIAFVSSSRFVYRADETLLRNAAAPAIHAFASGHRTSARSGQLSRRAIGPDFVRQHVCRILDMVKGRSRNGFAFLRLPPELRSARADDQQGNEGMAPFRASSMRTAYENVTRHYHAARGKNFSNFMMAMALLKN